MNSIRVKLAGSVLLIGLVGFIIAGISNYFLARKFIVDESIEKTKGITAQKAEKINAWFDAQKIMLESVGTAALSEENRDKIFEMFTEQGKKRPYLDSFYPAAM